MSVLEECKLLYERFQKEVNNFSDLERLLKETGVFYIKLVERTHPIKNYFKIYEFYFTNNGVTYVEDRNPRRWSIGSSIIYLNPKPQKYNSLEELLGGWRTKNDFWDAFIYVLFKAGCGASVRTARDTIFGSRFTRIEYA